MVYLLHFSRPYPRDSRASVQHYLGFTASARTLPQRLGHHRDGSGARLMAAVSAAGIGFTVARVWRDADRTAERRLKNRRNGRKLCPLCNPGIEEVRRAA